MYFSPCISKNCTGESRWSADGWGPGSPPTCGSKFQCTVPETYSLIIEIAPLAGGAHKIHY